MAPLISFFIIDPPERLDPPTDTTLAIMRESLRRGGEVFYCTLPDLVLEGDRLYAQAYPVRFPPGAELFTAGDAQKFPAEAADVVYMRKDPPVDRDYLQAAYLLDQLPPRVLQVNPSRTLRLHCEKLIPLAFPDLAPETLVGRSVMEIAAFLRRHQRIVVKPLDDCSGRGIVAVNASDPRAEELIDRAAEGGGRCVVAQRFLPEIREGDKRVLMLGEEILGWVNRRPAPGEFRSNVNAGGRCLLCELTARDRAICERVGPWLVREGIHFSGLDIVGPYLLEVNITSPSCLRELNQLTGQSLEKRVVDYVEENCRRARNFLPCR